MLWRKAAVFGTCVVVAAACGGESFSPAGSAGAGSNSGATAASAGEAGQSGRAGSPAMGGSSATGGSATSAGSAGAGGVDCRLVDCAFPICNDGAKPVTKPGECCPTCPPPTSGCEDVSCLPVTECRDGYELRRPDGACCEGCVPKPDGAACAKIACEPDMMCPNGYVRGDLVGGCCYDCLPDPRYCRDVDDCLLAEDPRACCGCPEAISRRMYEADACWNDPRMPRMLPQTCYSGGMCDLVCGACARPGPVACVEHRCTLGLPE